MTAPDLTHIAVDEAAGKADCSECGMGLIAPPVFGIPAANMLAAFVVQHSVHRGGKPSGLTPTRTSKAARETFLGLR